MLLYLASQDLKWPIDVMVRREVAAKGEVLFHLRGSEPKNFSQVGNHALRISLRCHKGNPIASRKRYGRQRGSMPIAGANAFPFPERRMIWDEFIDVLLFR